MDSAGVELFDENLFWVLGNIKKGQKLSKVSKMGTPTRKTLADISNLQQPSKPSNQNLKSPKALPFATQDYFEKLQMVHFSEDSTSLSFSFTMYV